MRKKEYLIIFFVLLLSSCDILTSFWVSPVFYIPSLKTAWTIDSGNNKIIGDSYYYGNDDWYLEWDNATNVIRISDYHSDRYNSSIAGFPNEILEYDYVNSPIFYFSLLFQDSFTGGIDIDAGGIYSAPSENVSLKQDNQNPIEVGFTRSITTTAGSTTSYTLPVPAYLGIDGSDTVKTLAGLLHVVDFTISSENSFVSGHAICVFSSFNPAGLLYMVYYHDSGLVSLIYAYDVATTETGNYFPDGHYEYVWSVYRP